MKRICERCGKVFEKEKGRSRAKQCPKCRFRFRKKMKI